MTDLPTFVNEPIGELRRASVRDELSRGHGDASSASSPCRSPCGSATASATPTS